MKLIGRLIDFRLIRGMKVNDQGANYTCMTGTPNIQNAHRYSKTRVYRGIHVFLIFAINIDCVSSLEPHH